MEQSFVQLYTGNGKGKTTAAAGLAARAAGRGLTVKFVQFLKGRESGETVSLERLGVELLRVSECKKFFRDMTREEKARARADVKHALGIIEGWLNSADLLVLDEAMGAVSCGILAVDEVLDIIARRGGTEIVLTGRDAPGALVKAAHLVTEMREIKHYYSEGQSARKGVEY
jgi:cob(I)alamin adenosyltransferase